VHTFFCYLLDVYIDFTPASSNWTSPGLRSTAPFLACCCAGAHDDDSCKSSSYPQSSASSPVQQQSELESNISCLSTSSRMTKWSVFRLWCKCLVVTIKKEQYSPEFLYFPFPVPLVNISNIWRVQQKNRLSCFMTPDTVEVCHMLQTGMILQCRNSRKIFKPYVMWHYTFVIKANLIPFHYHKNCIRYSTFNKNAKII
jgi:hypothetical protein